MPLDIYSKINSISQSIGFEDRLIQESSIIQHDDNFEPLDVQAQDCTLYTGDNLKYLLKLSSSHSLSVDLCYIDPPYNTGSTFLYDDSRKANDSGPFGRHSAWMRFMLPRLVAAKEVLSNTGVIAVSIDDYEHVYLRLLMDRIFGDAHFLGNIVVCRSKNGKGSKKNIASNHEHLVVYGKSKSATLRGAPDDETRYDKLDKHGAYRVDGLFRKKGAASLRTERPNMFYPLYYDTVTGEVFVEPASRLKKVLPLDSKGIERRWLWAKETTRKKSWKLYASSKGVIYVKNYSTAEKRTKIRTLWNSTSYYTERATIEIKKIFGEKIFDTPKPMAFIKDILDQMGEPDSIIMDFFAGSGTTAHVAHELNQIDGGSRKTILMESDAVIPKNHIAHQKGFKRVSDITIKRLEYLDNTDTCFSFKVATETHESSMKQVESLELTYNLGLEPLLE